MRVNYAKAVFGIEEENAVLDVLRNQKILLGGGKTKEFEESIAKIFGKKHGVMVNSGSSANLLALRILDFPPGSEVITPTLTYSTTVAPILQCGLKPVFVDTILETYQIDVSQIRSKITNNTKALMIPSLIGNIPDMKELRKICDENSLIFIEDSCDTLGASFDDHPTGHYSDITTTSFYASHVITAGGSGGMICVNDDALKTKCKVLRAWGRSSAADESEDIDKRFEFDVDGIKYDSKLIFSDMGYNFQSTEMNSAFGLEQLKKLEKFTESRINNYKKLIDFFSKYERFFILPKQSERVKTCWLAFPLTVKSDAPFTRSKITTFLEKNDIQTRAAFSGNILRHPAFKGCNEQSPEDFPLADKVMRNSFLIGCHHGLTTEEMNYMLEKFSEFLNKL